MRDMQDSVLHGVLHPKVVMAGLDPATQSTRVGAA